MNNDILQRYIKGEASQEEKDAIGTWLDADDKNKQDFLLQRGIYDAIIWNSKKEEHSEHLRKKEQTFVIRRKLVRELLKIAAVFLLALGCYSLFLSPKSDMTGAIALQSVHAPAGERAEITLSDGTKVWLNAKSTLTFPNQFEKTDRIVELDGEAYFDVTHDENKKFIVKTHLYDIKVFGTEFNVNAYSENNYFETALINGSVEVTSDKTGEKIILEPDKRVYTDTESNRLLLADIGQQDQFLWRNGLLYFEDQKVEDILEKLELYYDVTIEVKNTTILTHRYTGKFWTNDGVEQILRVLQLRHNFKYTKENMNKITIY